MKTGSFPSRRLLPIRAFQMHLTHYDPAWVKRKAVEKRFNMKLALEVVDRAAAAGFTHLIIDIEDAVRYKSHPELRRPYSVPISELAKLAARARSRGLDVIPKSNFSQSPLHRHNHWFRPHHDLFDAPLYFRRAFRIIDEIRRACRPKRFFHIGMDEDHERSHRQYVRAIKALSAGLRKRGLRAVIWNDTAERWNRAEVYAEKCLAAEARIPRSVVEVVWDYHGVRPDVFKRLRRRGFEVWVAPGWNPVQIAKMHAAAVRAGARGIVFTLWIPCRPGNRGRFLARIAQMAELRGKGELRESYRR